MITYYVYIIITFIIIALILFELKNYAYRKSSQKSRTQCVNHAYLKQGDL